MRGDRLQEVSNIVMWLGKFWYFGKLVAEDRLTLTKGVRNWRFHCTHLVMLVQRIWSYIKTPSWQVSTFSPSIYSRHENFDLQLLSKPVYDHFSLQLLPLKYYLPNRHDAVWVFCRHLESTTCLLKASTRLLLYVISNWCGGQYGDQRKAVNTVWQDLKLNNAFNSLFYSSRSLKFRNCFWLQI